MAYTYTANQFNSTPFSSCCNVASFGTRCDKCGAALDGGHQDDPVTAAAKRRTPPGHCLMCGKKRGDPAVAGNCHC